MLKRLTILSSSRKDLCEEFCTLKMSAEICGKAKVACSNGICASMYWENFDKEHFLIYDVTGTAERKSSFVVSHPGVTCEEAESRASPKTGRSSNLFTRLFRRQKLDDLELDFSDRGMKMKDNPVNEAADRQSPVGTSKRPKAKGLNVRFSAAKIDEVLGSGPGQTEEIPIMVQGLDVRAALERMTRIGDRGLSVVGGSVTRFQECMDWQRHVFTPSIEGPIDFSGHTGAKFESVDGRFKLVYIRDSLEGLRGRLISEELAGLGGSVVLYLPLQTSNPVCYSRVMLRETGYEVSVSESVKSFRTQQDVIVAAVRIIQIVRDFHSTGFVHNKLWTGIVWDNVNPEAIKLDDFSNALVFINVDGSHVSTHSCRTGPESGVIAVIETGKNICPSRAYDVELVSDLIEKIFKARFPKVLVPSVVGEFRQYSLELGFMETPEYDKWISAFQAAIS
jgi:hypothetical protein